MTNRINAGSEGRWWNANAANGRGTLVATGAGLALIERALERHVAVLRAIVSGLGDEEQNQLWACWKS